MKCLTLKQLTILVITSVVCATLSGCFGGSIAQQLVRSIFIQGADKVTGAAIEAKEQNDKLALQKTSLNNTLPDPYQIALVDAAFENVPLQIEALPENTHDENTALPANQETKIIESKLVQVEIWNLLIGDEKQSILEKARAQGVTNIPPDSEWQKWQVAVGAENKKTTASKKQEGIYSKTQTITFLIPPEMGKMFSGEIALVEVSDPGELNVARYVLN